MEQALRELSVTKQEEEEILRQRAIECQREFQDAMTRLQEQFVEQVLSLFPTAQWLGGLCAKADELKMTTMTQLAQYRSQCETAIESRARALSATLATGVPLFLAWHAALRRCGLQNRGRYRRVQARRPLRRRQGFRRDSRRRCIPTLKGGRGKSLLKRKTSRMGRARVKDGRSVRRRCTAALSIAAPVGIVRLFYRTTDEVEREKPAINTPLLLATGFAAGSVT